MSEALTIEAARGLYEAGGGGHDFDHVLRVTILAERIARGEDADLEIVRTAALLHDIGESQGRAEHHVLGAAMARQLLGGQSPAFVEAVAHAIEAHRYRAGPEPATLEARVVSDADKLDAVGAIGIARVFAYAGKRGVPLWRVPRSEIIAGEAARTTGEPDLERAVRAPIGGAYTPVHEYVYKLSRMSDRLYTATARTIAAGRQAYMEAFFDRLDYEMLNVEW